MSYHSHVISDTTKDRNIETVISPSFYPMIMKAAPVRTWINPLTLMVFFFFLPLQCFIIGDNLGLGIQGAVYRYQIMGSEISLIPITYEIGYITSGIYSGKSAVSVLLWVAGTFILLCTLLLSLIQVKEVSHRVLLSIIMGIASSCILYFASLVAQYGLFFSGPAGISIPAGIFIMILSALFLCSFTNFFVTMNVRTDSEQNP